MTVSNPDTQDRVPLTRTRPYEEQVGTCYMKQVTNTPRLLPACEKKLSRFVHIEFG